jgi:hypothetical protein
MRVGSQHGHCLSNSINISRVMIISYQTKRVIDCIKHLDPCCRIFLWRIFINEFILRRFWKYNHTKNCVLFSIYIKFWFQTRFTSQSRVTICKCHFLYKEVLEKKKSRVQSDYQIDRYIWDHTTDNQIRCLVFFNFLPLNKSPYVD